MRIKTCRWKGGFCCILFAAGSGMHEYGVTQSILRTVCDEAEKNGAARITGITLVVGELSSVLDDSVQMYFDLLSKGTAAEGAKLYFKRVRAQFLCESCGLLFVREKRDFACPSCGGMGKLTGRQGKEFYIESMEVE